MFKAAIFDYEGVIQVPVADMKEIARNLGIPEIQFNQIVSPHLEDMRRGQVTEEVFWQRLCRDLGRPVSIEGRVLWRNSFKKGFRLYPEILTMIQQLKEKGLKLAVVSNTVKPRVDIIKGKQGYDGFDVVILSCEAGMLKPDPEIYMLALKKLDVKPEECLYIDSIVENLQPARRLGIRSIVAKSPGQVVTEVMALVSQSSPS